MKLRATMRPVALLIAGAIAVHDLRYLLGFGGDAGHALAERGHGYMVALTPIVGVLLTFGFAWLLLRTARAGAAASASEVRVRRIWPVAALALVSVFTVQELLEGALASGHPSGFAGVVSSGGWVAGPLAVAFGGVIAFAVRVADVLERTSPLVRAPRPAAPARVAPAVVAAYATPARRVLAVRLPARGPPLAASRTPLPRPRRTMPWATPPARGAVRCGANPVLTSHSRFTMLDPQPLPTFVGASRRRPSRVGHPRLHGARARRHGTARAI
jgi:hypothetical protein